MKETPPHRCKYFRNCDDCGKEVGYFAKSKPPSRCVECRMKLFQAKSHAMFAYSRWRSGQRNFLYEKQRKESEDG